MSNKKIEINDLKELGFQPNSEFNLFWQKDDVIYNIVNRVVYLPKKGVTKNEIIYVDQLKKIMEGENKISEKDLLGIYEIEKVIAYKIATGETFNTLEEAINKRKLALLKNKVKSLLGNKSSYVAIAIFEFIIDNRAKLKEIFNELD